MSERGYPDSPVRTATGGQTGTGARRSKGRGAPRPETLPTRRGPPRRALVFALLCAACVLIAGGYTVLAARRAESAAQRALAEPAAAPEALAAVSERPHLLFLQSQGDVYRRLALVPLDGLDGPRYLSTEQCQRVHFAAGQGLCLGQSQLGGAYVFGADLKPRHTLPATGIPSRVRVAPDGRHGAMTVFVTGHSYSDGGFSTKTTLADLPSGQILGDLEEFAVYRDGARFQSVDFNFWGVTFARDSNRFYATLGSGGKTYLVEGDVASRELRVLRENVECPSLSPDNTRLVFKKRVLDSPGPVTWRLHLLDLATLTDQPLAETRSVDDQVEWLDDGHILYSLPDEGPPPTIRPDLWLLSLDDGGPPRRLQTEAFSPAVVH
jgi:hypothetical protein